MDTDLWPVAGLRLRTPRLELRLPSERDLATLARLAAAGVHDPALQPFEVEWTDAPPAEVSRSVLQHHWRQLADWSSARWTLPLAVVRAEHVVGIQSVSGRDFDFGPLDTKLNLRLISPKAIGLPILSA